MRVSRSIFLIACACNAFFAAYGTFLREEHGLALSLFGFFGGALSVLMALVLGFLVLLETPARERAWIKATLVFLTLGPVAYWTILWPAAIDTVCIGRGCYSAAGQAFTMNARQDVEQSQAAMAVVALIALVCAARASAVRSRRLAT